MNRNSRYDEWKVEFETKFIVYFYVLCWALILKRKLLKTTKYAKKKINK